MFPESYTKFYVFMIVALLLSFVIMEGATTSSAIENEGLSGMATHSIDDVGESKTGNGTPGSNLIFLLIGVVAGAVIVGTAVYIYSVEKKRMY